MRHTVETFCRKACFKTAWIEFYDHLLWDQMTRSWEHAQLSWESSRFHSDTGKLSTTWNHLKIVYCMAKLIYRPLRVLPLIWHWLRCFCFTELYGKSPSIHQSHKQTSTNQLNQVNFHWAFLHETKMKKKEFIFRPKLDLSYIKMYQSHTKSKHVCALLDSNDSKIFFCNSVKTLKYEFPIKLLPFTYFSVYM